MRKNELIAKMINFSLYLLKWDEAKVTKNEVNNYFLGDDVDYDCYKRIRKDILQKLLSIDTKKLNPNDVLNESRKQLIIKLFDNYLSSLTNDMYNCSDYDIIKSLFQLVVSVKSEYVYYECTSDYQFKNGDRSNGADTVFTTNILKENELNESNVDYQRIIDIDECQIFLKHNFKEDFYNEEDIDSQISNGNFNIYNFKIRDFKGSKELSATTYLNQIELRDIDCPINRIILKANISYCETSYAWEDYFIESIRFFETRNIRMAFLQLFICFDSLVECYNLVLKNQLKSNIYTYARNKSDNIEFLLDNIYKSFLNDDLEDENIENLYYYRKLSDDNRDLINDKFVNIIKLHYYKKNGIKYKEFDNKNSKMSKHRKKLNSLSKLRNSLAHGSITFNDQDYQLYKSSYLTLFTIVIETLLFLQDTDILNLLLDY